VRAGRDEPYGIAIRPGTAEPLGSDGAGRGWAIVDDELLAETLAEAETVRLIVRLAREPDGTSSCAAAREPPVGRPPRFFDSVAAADSNPRSPVATRRPATFFFRFEPRTSATARRAEPLLSFSRLKTKSRVRAACRTWIGFREAVNSAPGVRRDKAALSSRCESHPATAPAGSNRSCYGGERQRECAGRNASERDSLTRCLE
jgi:hypothetical protein